jgi:signal transduction histidine kinase
MLKAFINEIIEEMNVLAKKNNNSIEFSPERDIRVFADKFQLKRIIKNLIQNAILYGKSKTPIEITIGEIPQYIFIKVKDFGEGISAEEIEKIFNKYYSAAKKFRKIGTGLGLYLSLQLARAHEGDLTVKSKEGEFTEFCIKIPVKEYDQSFT